MKLNHLNLSNEWFGPLKKVVSNRTKTYEKLKSHQIHKIYDLLFLFPRKIYQIPNVAPFYSAKEGQIFRGRGKVINAQTRPGKRGKTTRGPKLSNIFLNIQDVNSDQSIVLKWFNVFPQQIEQLKRIDFIEFMGTVSKYQGQFQIMTPEYINLNRPQSYGQSDSALGNYEEIQFSHCNGNSTGNGQKFSEGGPKREYPTINGVEGRYIHRAIDKISLELWEGIEDYLEFEFLEEKNFPTLKEMFYFLHGKNHPQFSWTESNYQRAKNRLNYEQALGLQLRFHIKQELNKQLNSPIIEIEDDDLTMIKGLFPYQLSNGQEEIVHVIREELQKSFPMIRLVQGEVGSGKTCIALTSGLMAITSNFQVAFMCPSEILAHQHFKALNQLVKGTEYESKIALLVGGMSEAIKKEIREKLEKNEIHFVVGTHTLIQQKTQFSNLGLIIIDEQQKFGVEQRNGLLKKAKGVNCLIMTATPIPRTLCLTHFGDLSISTLAARKGQKKNISTKIIDDKNFDQFLNFFKTRLEMGEQAYLVAPAIFEQSRNHYYNTAQIQKRFQAFFPEYSIEIIHGRMEGSKKASIFQDFTEKKIQILVSTSVLEVGVDVHNATIMGILNPEKFGLSSLHQLRGRVGRGKLPGFCFLINDRPIAAQSMERLKIIEEGHDGLKIAEADLRLRGQGNLMGAEQAGKSQGQRVDQDYEFMNEVKNDLIDLIGQGNDHLIQQIKKNLNSPQPSPII